MTRESDIATKLGLDRKELRAARSSGLYAYGDDWLKVANAICWTDVGRAKLAESVGAADADLAPGEGDSRRAVVLPVRVLNPRLVRCQVEGFAESQVVYVGDNRLYRPGLECYVHFSGNGWKGAKRPSSEAAEATGAA
jgi:hypothetical protein